MSVERIRNIHALRVALRHELTGPLAGVTSFELQVEVADEHGQYFWREITREERDEFRAQGWTFGETADGS